MNKRKIGLLVAVIAILAVAAVGVYVLRPQGNLTNNTNPEQQPTLRVAWMTSWATAGQVVEALIHTDILKRHGVKAEFKSFLFGPPMNEAALAGNVDVTIVGDMPAISLLGRSGKWSVVSRTIYFPYALMVRSDVEANDIADLKGKTIGVPFGSGPQPTLYRWLEEMGLKIESDVKVINILPNEIGEAIKSKRVDAVMTWEPTMTVLEKDKSARVLKEAKGVGFMCMSNEFIEKHPDVVRRFVAAWKEALFYTAQHRKETDEWFATDSRFPLDLLASIRIVDDNLKMTNLEGVDVRLTDEDIMMNQQKADFALEQKLIAGPLDVRKQIRQEFATEGNRRKL